MTKTKKISFALLAGTLLTFCVCSVWVKSGGADAFDLAVNGFVQSFERPPLTVAMIIVSNLAAWYVLIPAALLFLAFPKTRRPLGIPAGVVLVLSGALNYLLKLSFAVTRPEIHRLVTVADYSYSFPSGHTMTSAAFVFACAALSFRFALKPLAKFAIMTGAALFVFAVGVSRIYLGVHHATDVLAGWAAGVFVCAITITVLFRKYT